jgi:hypothetical protein
MPHCAINCESNKDSNELNCDSERIQQTLHFPVMRPCR